MGNTFAEKILALKSGKHITRAGEIVDAVPDAVLCSAATFAIAIEQFNKLGAERIWDSGKAIVILGHFVPAPSLKIANSQKIIRDFVRQQGIEHFYDLREGVEHQVMVEKGHVLPGTLIIGKDSHTISYGALGAFSVGIGATETAVALATGKIWLRVPESIKITLTGKLGKGTYAKDIALKIVKDMTSDGCTYKCVEFDGESIQRMSISERLTIANMAMEVGAKACYFAFDETAKVYLEKRNSKTYSPISPDADAIYESSFEFDCSQVEPMVACPHSVDNGRRIQDVEGIEINQAFIGSCTNGRTDDLGIAAEILDGREVHPNVRLIVAPASREVLLEAIERNYIKTLVKAGALIQSPGCSACTGTSQGVLANGERCISSQNRNFKGRMGSPDSEIYLGSPATVAASAIEGKITDPRKFM